MTTGRSSWMSEISWWPSGHHSRGQAGTIAGGTKKEIVQVAAVGALHLGLEDKLQIFRTKSGPSALHWS